MQLYNASSLFNENAMKEALSVTGSPEKLREKIIAFKMALLKAYNFKAYNLPANFTETSYVIATNHLTDSDAPLIMSYYHDLMSKYKDTYPELFVFAKENCFNGVSISKELVPILEMEKVTAVDRNSQNGSIKAIRTAKKWFDSGEKPKHFLIFAQGTIYDINKDKVEDIEKGAFWLAQLLNIQVLPAFIEQAVEGAENRIIFAEPISVSDDNHDFTEQKQIWLDRVIAAQNSLAELTGVPAREAMLDEQHKTRKRTKVVNPE